eukprot:Skav207437  [mRNA]  locus=scaffold1798:348095:354080:+ [translate_table: standard]
MFSTATLCRPLLAQELVLEGVAWLGVTWELLEETIEDCCALGTSLDEVLGERGAGFSEIPAVLLELRRGPCGASTAAACPAWLGRQGQLREAARRGSAAAQTKWGIQLNPGGWGWMQEASQSSDSDRERKQREAIRWYKRAAKAGESSAATRLAFLYLTGDGVPKDGSKGFWAQWLKRHDGSMVDGRGGRRLLWQAALQGEASAMCPGSVIEISRLAGWLLRKPRETS